MRGMECYAMGGSLFLTGFEFTFSHASLWYCIPSYSVQSTMVKGSSNYFRFEVEQEHYKMALALAEKYEDYTLMISICEKEGNSEKIEKYKATLADKVCIL